MKIRSGKDGRRSSQANVLDDWMPKIDGMPGGQDNPVRQPAHIG